MAPRKSWNSKTAGCRRFAWTSSSPEPDTTVRCTKRSPPIALWRNSPKNSTLLGMQAAPPHGIPGNPPKNNDPREKLIVALDVSTAVPAKKIVSAVRHSAPDYTLRDTYLILCLLAGVWGTAAH